MGPAGSPSWTVVCYHSVRHGDQMAPADMEPLASAPAVAPHPPTNPAANPAFPLAFRGARRHVNNTASSRKTEAVLRQSSGVILCPKSPVQIPLQVIQALADLTLVFSSCFPYSVVGSQHVMSFKVHSTSVTVRLYYDLSPRKDP
ncbi:hypothetical protein MDA_GLEAN10017907 [Myotis davidii]|uniref:Uncharacterized protein n=1 Tax=Myotis davidii TaxID=225400 RepID=L5LFB7_MYODS|nr:hypothetical protein MDA_GLEAN10017907 [Myotis davidii]